MMSVRTCMKHKVFFVKKDETISTAAAVMRENRIGTLPVVENDMKLVGMLRLENLLALVMPDFIQLVEHFEFAHNFGPLESKKPDPLILKQAVEEIMEEPISVQQESGVLRAAALLHFRDLRDLPVVDDMGALVGLVSHVDLGIALMDGWDLPNFAADTSP